MMCNRIEELDVVTPIYNKDQGPKIGACSNIRRNRLADSGRKVKADPIVDGEIPMHVVRSKS